LLIELKFLNDKIKVIEESLFNIFPDVIVQRRLNVERLIRLFNFLNPHVQRIKFLLNQVIEVVRCVENTINRTHQKRKESKSQKLQADRENVFIGCMTSVISISNSGDYFKYPIESKNISCVIWFWVKSIVVNPTIYTDDRLIWLLWAFYLHSKS